GHVRHLEKQRLDARVELAELPLTFLDAALQCVELRALVVGGCAVDLRRCAPLLGAVRFHRGAEPACLSVVAEDLVDGRRLSLATRALAHRLGIVPDALEGQHQGSSARSLGDSWYPWSWAAAATLRCCGRIVGKSSTSRMLILPVSTITSRSTPTPSPPAGGMPTSIASRKSSSMGGISAAPAARSCACSSKRRRWSTGSLSSLNALASSRPATMSSKRSTKRGSSTRRRASGETSAG